MESKAYRVYMSDMLLGANNRLIVLNAAWGNPSDMLDKRFYDILHPEPAKSVKSPSKGQDEAAIKSKFINAFKE